MAIPSRRVLFRYARTNRRFQVVAAITSFIVFLLWLRFVYFRNPISTFPEVYRPYYAAERAMPQHNTSLPFPEGKYGKYLYVDQIHDLGWNNAFQELYMLAHLAYLTNRSFVYRPYTWSRGFSNYVYRNGRYSPSRIPETAILSGPIVGSNFPPSSRSDASSKYPQPRSVSEEYFNCICPNSHRRKLNLNQLHKGMGFAEGSKILDYYVRIIDNIEEGCLELSGRDEHIFDWKLFGDKQTLSLWPSVRTSPILTEFSWSDTVLSALRLNARLLHPAFHVNSCSHPHSIPQPHIPPPSLPSAPSLLALHIRRGDYIHHCNHLTKRTSTFIGWAQFPGLPAQDRFEVPQRQLGEREIKRIYGERCWPTIERIVEKVDQVRREWVAASSSKSEENRVPLTRVYVMTNGAPEWISELKRQLVSLGGWESVATSLEMELTEAQKWIAQAVDMAIAERAGVFVGNGFSSLSGNVALLRLVKGLPLESIRFW